MEEEVASRFRWPIISLDFEASGFGPASFPIEIGISLWGGPSTPIRTWSSLIAPTADWIERGHWSPESEAVHGISREMLRDGTASTEVVTRLEGVVGVGAMLLCDGGTHDAEWLARLLQAAGRRPTFFIGSWAPIFASLDPEAVARARLYQHENRPPHRAGPDAALNIRVLIAALGLSQPSEEQIVDGA